MSNTKFKEWLETFLTEKELDLEETFTVEGPSGSNYMDYQHVVNSILSANANEQKSIKEVLVKIDFANGDVRHFFKHLAKAIAL